MDVTKLKGLVSAVEDESTRPSPSHNNLARLTAMFMHEIIALLEPSNKQSAYSPRHEQAAVMEESNAPEPIVEPVVEKPKKKLKTAKG